MNVSLVKTSRAVIQQCFSISALAKRLSTNPQVKSAIEQVLKENKVVVFMKGVHGAPKCGFSNAVSQILAMHGVDFKSVDVLADENLRQGIKEYTNWPTIPQVFIDQQFIGGCDIIQQMHRDGQLIETLKKAGINSALDSK